MTTLLLLGALTTPVLAATPEARVVTPLSETDLTIALESGEWRVRQEARGSQFWQDQPALAQDLWAVQPQVTRAGFLRFWGGIVDESGAEVILLERLVHGDESAGVRHALIDAIARSGVDHAQAFVELMPLEPDGWVRAAYVNSLRKQELSLASAMFRQALDDRDAYVRAEGARSIGWHPEGDQLSPELIAALSDTEASVREAAARSLGIHKVSSAFSAVAGLLFDPDAEVRLQALHAVERIDAKRASGVAAPLLDDADSRISRLATRVTGL